MNAPWSGLRPTRDELREMLRLAGPLVLVNVGLMLMGVVDTLMLGRVSGEALAAGGLGHFCFWSVATVGFGLIMSVDPVVAQAAGANDAVGAARGAQRGVLIAVLVTVLASIALLPAGPFLELLRQPAGIARLAGDYALWSIPGLLPFFLFGVARGTWQAYRVVRPILIGVLVGNIANALLNWIFIFGHLGVEPAGVVGSAISTSIARWIMLGAAVAAGWGTLRPSLRPWRPESFALAPLQRMLLLGLPIGLQFFVEFNAFGLVTIFMGWLGTAQLAGHEIALNLSSLTFQVPLGASAAVSVMVGRAVGRGDMLAARRDAVAGIVIGVGFMAVAGAMMIVLPGALSRLYTAEPAVLVVATALLPLAGLFQVFDGTQAVATGVLRGAGDTRVPMLIHLVGFWAIGIPMSAWLCFGAGMGATGLWWGFVAGLATVALLHLWRVRARLGRDIQRLVMDHPPSPRAG